MLSLSRSSLNLNLNLNLPLFSPPPRSRSRFSLTSTTSPSFGFDFPSRSRACGATSRCVLKLNGTNIRRFGCYSRRSFIQYRAADEDSGDIMSLDNWDDNEGPTGYAPSSDGEDSDGDIVLTPITDVDLPAIRVSTNEAVTVAATRLASLGRGQKKPRIKYGVLINLGLITFLVMLISYADWCAWRIVRLPLEPFHLSRPFFVSALLVTCAGYVCIPFLDTWKIHNLIRKEGPSRHFLKKTIPTMGGLFFVPIGVIVAKFFAGFSSIEVSGAAAITIAFSSIGLADDILSLAKNQTHGLRAWLKILLEVAAGACFSLWLDTKNISSPYGMRMLIPLPAPLGLVCLGKCYHLLTTFCFVSMGNGVNLTDGLDGLAGGTSALAFVGMSIAVLPICPDLAIFGASMSGACVGFLLHNRYKASLFMGDTGSLGLGGALAAMAAGTGMFFPLFISSGIFVWEALSVILQVSYFKITKHSLGAGRRLFRMVPFHYHLELCGLKEPIIVAGACLVSCLLSMFAGYVGLISA